MHLKKTLIIGLGLIGGSFAKALKEHKITDYITAIDLDEESLSFAKDGNIINEYFLDLRYLEGELNNFDLIVIAAPLSAYEAIFHKIAKSTALTIDLGSVKNFQFKKLPKNFIPCHPIAGLDTNGFEYSDANLFKNKKFIICKKNPEIFDLAKKIGALPENMESEKHDEIYALISHLPQFLSFLTREFSPKKIEGDFLSKAFRLDNSNPEIWEDIFAMNQDNLEKFYLEFFDNLEDNFDKKAEYLIESISVPKLDYQENNDYSWKFIEENAPAILFRLIIVASYLEIKNIQKLLPLSGSGFKDFTSITALVDFDKEKIINLMQDNKKQLQKLLESIS